MQFKHLSKQSLQLAENNGSFSKQEKKHFPLKILYLVTAATTQTFPNAAASHLKHLTSKAWNDNKISHLSFILGGDSFQILQSLI